MTKQSRACLALWSASAIGIAIMAYCAFIATSGNVAGGVSAASVAQELPSGISSVVNIITIAIPGVTPGVGTVTQGAANGISSVANSVANGTTGAAVGVGSSLGAAVTQWATSGLSSITKNIVDITTPGVGAGGGSVPSVAQEAASGISSVANIIVIATPGAATVSVASAVKWAASGLSSITNFVVITTSGGAAGAESIAGTSPEAAPGDVGAAAGSVASEIGSMAKKVAAAIAESVVSAAHYSGIGMGDLATEGETAVAIIEPGITDAVLGIAVDVRNICLRTVTELAIATPNVVEIAVSSFGYAAQTVVSCVVSAAPTVLDSIASLAKLGMSAIATVLPIVANSVVSLAKSAIATVAPIVASSAKSAMSAIATGAYAAYSVDSDTLPGIAYVVDTILRNHSVISNPVPKEAEFSANEKLIADEPVLAHELVLYHEPFLAHVVDLVFLFVFGLSVLIISAFYLGFYDYVYPSPRRVRQNNQQEHGNSSNATPCVATAPRVSRPAEPRESRQNNQQEHGNSSNATPCVRNVATAPRVSRPAELRESRQNNQQEHNNSSNAAPNIRHTTGPRARSSGISQERQNSNQRTGYNEYDYDVHSYTGRVRNGPPHNRNHDPARHEPRERIQSSEHQNQSCDIPSAQNSTTASRQNQRALNQRIDGQGSYLACESRIFNEMCPICHEPLEELVQSIAPLPCGHGLHQSCSRSPSGRNCPLCRMEFEM